MPDAARLAYYSPIPWVALGAVIGVIGFGMHGIGSLILVLLALGFFAKRFYRWQMMASGGDPAAMPAWASCAGPWGRRDRRAAEPKPSGNTAFDDYRREMLRRLEQDHEDFQSFLDRLRRAKDKSEFDQFMSERDRPSPQGPQPGERPHSPWPQG